MDSLAKKTVTTKRGFTYTYYVSPAVEGKPTLFLQHGFPDDASEWEDLIVSHLKPAGYGVVAPDQLGYAGTSKPTDPAAYKWTGLTADYVDILDAEGLDKVISLGHDWGSRSAQLFWNLRGPERVSGLVMVNVAHSPTSRAPFDLDATLAFLDAKFGYGMWYWKFFTADDGARVMRDKADALFDVLHAPQSWVQTLGTKDNMRKAVEGDGEGFDVKRRPYATEERKRTFLERMRRDGFEGPTCWYKSHVFGHQDGEGNPDNDQVTVPTLYIQYPDDAICCFKDIQAPSIQAGLLPHLTEVTLEGAHWGLVENPKPFGEAVTKWLSENY